MAYRTQAITPLIWTTSPAPVEVAGIDSTTRKAASSRTPLFVSCAISTSTEHQRPSRPEPTAMRYFPGMLRNRCWPRFHVSRSLAGFQLHRISYCRPSRIRTYQQKPGRFSVFRSLILVTHAFSFTVANQRVASRSNTTGARVIPLCRRFVTELVLIASFNGPFSHFDSISLSYTIQSTLLTLLESASGRRPLSSRDRSSSTYSCHP